MWWRIISWAVAAILEALGITGLVQTYVSEGWSQMINDPHMLTNIYVACIVAGITLVVVTNWAWIDSKRSSTKFKRLRPQIEQLREQVREYLALLGNPTHDDDQLPDLCSALQTVTGRGRFAAQFQAQGP